MFGDGAVKGGRDLVWKGRGAARLTINVDADQFSRGRQSAAFLYHHEMHEVKALFRAVERPGAYLHCLTLAELNQIPGMLLKSKGASQITVEVVQIHAQAGKKSPGCLVKEVCIPHDVHMPHLVQVRGFDGGLMANRQIGQVNCINQGQRPLSG